MGQSFVPIPFPSLHRGGRKLPLTRTFCVAINFLRALMTSDRHYLAMTRAKLRESCCTGLSESVCRAMRQPSFIAPFTESVAKSVNRERLAKLGNEIRFFP